MKKIIVICLIGFATACSKGSSTPTAAPGAVATGTVFTITAPNSPTSYTINNVDNPALTLQRGQTYTFNISSVGHPFFISTTSGTNVANAYNTGVTNNNIQSGTLTFVVPMTAPNTLFYDCANHAAMSGTITVTN
jgi:hypothetical protein